LLEHARIRRGETGSERGQDGKRPRRKRCGSGAFRRESYSSRRDRRAGQPVEWTRWAAREYVEHARDAALESTGFEGHQGRGSRSPARPSGASLVEERDPDRPRGSSSQSRAKPGNGPRAIAKPGRDRPLPGAAPPRHEADTSVQGASARRETPSWQGKESAANSARRGRLRPNSGATPGPANQPCAVETSLRAARTEQSLLNHRVATLAHDLMPGGRCEIRSNLSPRGRPCSSLWLVKGDRCGIIRAPADPIGAWRLPLCRPG
jgi:hypothetical protein